MSASHECIRHFWEKALYLMLINEEITRYKMEFRQKYDKFLYFFRIYIFVATMFLIYLLSGKTSLSDRHIMQYVELKSHFW